MKTLVWVEHDNQEMKDATLAAVTSADATLVITMRGTAFEKAAAEGGSGAVEAVSGFGNAGVSSFISEEIAESNRPKLTSAKIIVRGAARSGRCPS